MSYRGKLLVEAALFEMEKKRKREAEKSASNDKTDAKTIRLDKDKVIPNEEKAYNRKTVRDGPASYKVRKEAKVKVEESLSEEQQHHQTKTREEENGDDTGKEDQKDNVTENISNKEDEGNIETAMSVQCSFGKKCDRLENEPAIQLLLRRVQENTQKDETYTVNSVWSEEDIDDTNEDPDFDGLSIDISSSSESVSTEREKNLKKDGNEERFQYNDEVHDTETQIEESNKEEDRPGGYEKRKCKKIKVNPSDWIRNKAKYCRNKGESYISNSKNPKEVRQRALQPSCNDKCKLECQRRINQEMRQAIFKQFWGLGNLQLQREYITKLMMEVNPTYRYKREGSTRGLNHAFHLIVDGRSIRVCKKFLKATLDINDRMIRTVIKKNKDGFIAPDERGKHGNQKSVDPDIKQGIRDHINSIPRVESHCLCTQSTREYIEGRKTVASLYRDYAANCTERKVPCGNLTMYMRIFNGEFNISFFTPKKDQCELCTAFNNAENEKKT